MDSISVMSAREFRGRICLEKLRNDLTLVHQDIADKCEEGSAAVAFSLARGVRDHELEFAGHFYCFRG